MSTPRQESDQDDHSGDDRWAPSDEELQDILESHHQWTEWRKCVALKPQPVLYRESDWPVVEGSADLSIGTRADLRDADLRKAELGGIDLSGAYLENADLSGCLLHRTNFSRAALWDARLINADLEHADLSGANLKGADLSRAHLGPADLARADLQESNLSDAYLGGTDLSEANLRSATLSNATLIDALMFGSKLQDANLEGVSGLRGRQLRGTDLSGANLPEPIYRFEPLQRVRLASRSARKLFISLLLACGYSAIASINVGSGGNSVQLPLLNASVPGVGFFLITPVLLLLLYAYFQVQLQRVWDELAKLPARFPDGNLLDEKIYPWLVTGIVRAHIEDLEEDRPPLFGLQRPMTVLIAWGCVPLTLGAMGLIALTQCRWWVGGFNLLLCAGSILFAGSLYETAIGTIERKHRKRHLKWGSFQLLWPWSK